MDYEKVGFDPEWSEPPRLKASGTEVLTLYHVINH